MDIILNVIIVTVLGIVVIRPVFSSAWFKRLWNKLKLNYRIRRLGIGKDYKIGSNKSKIK